MSHGLLFAVLMLLWLVLGIWGAWPPANSGYRFLGSQLLLFILLLLLGWKCFGPLIHS